MKRLVLGILGAFLLFLSMTPSVYAGTNDFTFSKLEADYYLGSDKDGRSALRTVERLTAEFPQFDQNHGIERAIPQQYDGHKVSLDVLSVTDDQDKSLNYSTYTSNDNEVLRIGDSDTYVHGTKTYVITYTQRDVTRYFSDTGRDEFYWDVNGTEWQQPFTQVTARVHLSDSIKQTLSKDVACYQGYSGSTQRCEIQSDGTTISTTVNNLSAGQNVTLAIGFTAGTFRGYEPTMFEKIFAFLFMVWIAATILTTVAALILLIWLPIRYSRQSNRRKDIGTIIAEYLPPKDTSILAAAHIGEGTKGETTAQLIDFAVRHYLRIYQTKEKSLWKSAEYELEIIKSIDDLSQEEQELLQALFKSSGTAVGSRFAMESLKNNYTTGAELRSNDAQLIKRIKGDYGLRHKDEAESKWFKRIAWWALGISILTFSPLLLIAAIVAFVCASQLYPLTDKGLDLRVYLAGLKLYISVAEEERLKMLQSPEGAEKVGRKIGEDTKQLVKLYERVLPYAVLFGQEKEWNKQLGVYYEKYNTQPDWYSGHTAFNAALFTSAMSDFGTASNSYSSSSSSSSGGSSGGGSSGGGGGGGGGGGW